MLFVDYLTERKAFPISGSELLSFVAHLYNKNIKKEDKFRISKRDGEKVINLHIQRTSEDDPAKPIPIRINVAFVADAKNYMPEILKKELRKTGWFVVGRYEAEVGDGANATIIELEPNYGIPVTKVPKTIYHAAPTVKLKKIMKGGLKPMSGNRRVKYPPRIFFGMDKVQVLHLSAQLSMDSHGASALMATFMAMTAQGPMGKPKDYAILKIDTKKLKKGTKFYKDTDFPTGIYTYTHIPAAAISVVE